MDKKNIKGGIMEHSQEHYKQKKFEPIQIIEEYELGFHLGNAVKYILRSEYKDSKIEDIEKSIWYLERELHMLRIQGGEAYDGLSQNAIDKWNAGYGGNADGDGRHHV